VTQKVPPDDILPVVCTFSFTAEGYVRLVVNKFGKEITQGKFFDLRIPGFTSPRSTAETESF